MTWQPDVKKRIHDLYWNENVNCARTTLRCLGERFSTEIEPQTWASAVGMHGAGGFGAQCGLVEGALLFLGIELQRRGWQEEAIAEECCRYAEAFTQRFGSLRCCELRPGGFSADDPPHRCELLTCDAVAFAIAYLEALSGDGPRRT